MTDHKRFTILRGSGKPAHDLTGEMAERVKAIIYEYAGRVPVAAAIGVLTIVQREILDEQ